MKKVVMLLVLVALSAFPVSASEFVPVNLDVRIINNSAYAQRIMVSNILAGNIEGGTVTQTVEPGQVSGMHVPQEEDSQVGWNLELPYAEFNVLFIRIETNGGLKMCTVVNNGPGSGVESEGGCSLDVTIPEDSARPMNM